MTQPSNPAASRDEGRRNLDPVLDALGHRLEHAALVRIPDPAPAAGKPAAPAAGTPAHQVLRFQYNPETVTRTRQGGWEARKQRRGGVAPPQESRTERGGMGSGAVNAESEQITFKLVFDATEAILGRREGAAETGILPELAFLEVGARGQENAAPPAKGAKPGQKAQAVRPDEMLLVLGGRAYPVVITSLSIAEQKFLPTLVPVRAEVDLRLTVLESGESAYRQWISTSFTELMRQRTEAAAAADFGGELQAVTAALTTAFAGPAAGAA